MNKVAHNFRHAFLPCRAYGKSGVDTNIPAHLLIWRRPWMQFSSVAEFCVVSVRPLSPPYCCPKQEKRIVVVLPPGYRPTDRRDGPMTCVVRPTGSRNRGDVAKCRSPSAGGILHVPVLFTRYWCCEGGEAISLQSVSATSGGRRPHCGRPVIRFPACWCFHGNRP